MMRKGEIVICEQEAVNVRTIFRLAGDDRSAGEITDSIVKDDYFDDDTDKIVSKIHELLRKDYYYGCNSYPAIVDKASFDKARECIRQRDHFHCADKTRIPYKLTCCGMCGCQLKRIRNAENKYWKCRNTSCKSFNNLIPEEELFRQIIEILNKAQADHALLDTDTVLTKYVPTRAIIRGESIVLARCYSKPLDYDRVRKEVENLSYDTEKLRTVDLNEAILDMVADKNYVILSSGIKMLWERFSERFALKNVIADTLISADTKYFVVKLLQEKGYTVTAYGDGRNDYYMLKQADKGYLYIGKYLSRSLRDSDLSGISLVYDISPYILADNNGCIADDIAILISTVPTT